MIDYLSWVYQKFGEKPFLAPFSSQEIPLFRSFLHSLKYQGHNPKEFLLAVNDCCK